jgi:hypothetical protein
LWGLYLHIENALAQNSKLAQTWCGQARLKRLSHPPYSPDISLSNLYLFGKVKGALIGREIPDEIGPRDGGTELAQIGEMSLSGSPDDHRFISSVLLYGESHTLVGRAIVEKMVVKSQSSPWRHITISKDTRTNHLPILR